MPSQATAVSFLLRQRCCRRSSWHRQRRFAPRRVAQSSWWHRQRTSRLGWRLKRRKTTLVLAILGRNEESAPTVGFEPHTVKLDGTPVRLFDCGGGAQIRGIWSNYWPMCTVPSSSWMQPTPGDSTRRGLLHEAQEHERLRGKPLLVVANKQTCHSRRRRWRSPRPRMHLLSDAAYHIVGGCAKCGGTVGEPLLGGLGWLEKRVRADWGALQPRRERQKAEQKAEEARKRDERKARLAAKRAAREAEEAAATAETAAPVGPEEMGGIELPPADPVNDDPGARVLRP